MNDERLVREMWKELPLRPVVGARLVRSVGARGWERPRFARFGRFFERCGVPDPWDPGAGNVEIGLGEVGVAQRKQVAPHAAPPAASGGPKPQGFANVPRAPAAPPPESRASVEGKPAPRIGETRKDDTAILKKKLAESERLKADPARANLYKVNQPVAKLPQRPDLGDGTAAPRGASPRPGASRPGEPRAADPRAAAPLRPPAPRPPSSAPARPFRMPIDPGRRAVVPDGPEEVPEPPPVAARPNPARGYGDFGLGGGWDDDEPPARPVRPPPPPVSHAVETSEAPPAASPSPAPSAPPRPPAPTATPVAPVGVRPASTPGAPPASAAPPRPTPPGPAASPPVSRPPEPPRPAATPPKPGSPPPRPGKPGGGGLDDLFGMGGGAGDNTRFRMPKRDEADPAKPRRPMVTPDAELGKGGLDRRPPPPKPPAVTPTGGPSKPAPDFDGDGGD